LRFHESIGTFLTISGKIIDRGRVRLAFLIYAFIIVVLGISRLLGQN
jgi:hypothetical protein